MQKNTGFNETLHLNQEKCLGDLFNRRVGIVNSLSAKSNVGGAWMTPDRFGTKARFDCNRGLNI